MDSAQGFSAQGAGAIAILVATALGYPISSTHAISGGVMGAGAAKRVSAVRWGVAGKHRRRLAADPARDGGDRGVAVRGGDAFGA